MALENGENTQNSPRGPDRDGTLRYRSRSVSEHISCPEETLDHGNRHWTEVSGQKYHRLQQPEEDRLMSTDEELAPDMRDLLAAVGEVLLKWGFLEHDMEKWLRSERRAVERKLSADRIPIIKLWRDTVRPSATDVTGIRSALLADVEEVASVRNSLAHGLWSASANPWNGKQAEVVCRARDGTCRSIAYSELLETERRLHSLRERVRMLDFQP